MPASTVSGFASGIDWQKTIDMLMQIERQPVDRMVQRKALYQQKTAAWNAISEKLTALQSSAQSIDTQDELLRKTAASSDTNIISASAKSGAVSGTHTIEVNQLAQSEVYVHSGGWADLNSTAVYSGTGGQFVYNYDGSTYTVSVPNNATLLDLVQLINNDENNPGVTASTIDDGGTTDPVHLVLTSDDPKSANSFSIDASTNLGTGTEFDDASWTRTKNAQEAEIRVDGYPPASWITRTSNVIDDVLEGLTLTLKDTTTSAVNVSVEDDYTAIKQRVSDWVKAYNDVMKEISTDIRYDSENEVQGILMGDSQVRTVRDQLTNIMVNVVPGLPSGSEYLSLGDIGLEVSTSGTITINDDELQAALENNAENVANLIAKSTATNNSSLQFLSSTDATEGGSYDVQATYLASGLLDASGTNTIDGYAATVESGNILVGKDGTPVEGLRVQFAYPGGGAGTASATVRYGTGTAVQVDNKISTYTDSFDGLIKGVKDAYQSQIDNLDDQITAYEQRLATKKEMLTKQFLAMEDAISKAKNQSNWTSAIG